MRGCKKRPGRESSGAIGRDLTACAERQSVQHGERKLNDAERAAESPTDDRGAPHGSTHAARLPALLLRGCRRSVVTFAAHGGGSPMSNSGEP